MDNVKKAAKTITFENELIGNVSIDRGTLVEALKSEHRSYANHSCTIKGTKSFQLPELTEQYPSGFSLGLVIALKDNKNSDNKKGAQLSL